MSRVTRDKLFAAPLATKEVDVEQWGGTVLIGEMPIGRRNALLKSIMGEDGKVNVDPDIELKLLIAGMHDPELSEDDWADLQSVSGAAVSAVAKEIMRFNGMSPDAQDDARGEF